MAKTEKLAVSFGIRDASKYLDKEHGIDVSEMRIRSLVRQHEIFLKDEGTRKVKAADSEIAIWKISRAALDVYAAAYKSGNIRSTGGGVGGAKLYRISLTTEQYTQLREFCVAQGIPEPARPKYYNQSKKAKAARAAARNGDGVDEGDDETEWDEEDGEDLEAMLQEPENTQAA
jgi:hypothetical protein